MTIFPGRIGLGPSETYSETRNHSCRDYYTYPRIAGANSQHFGTSVASSDFRPQPNPVADWRRGMSTNALPLPSLNWSLAVPRQGLKALRRVIGGGVDPRAHRVGGHLRGRV